jgi:hypothetical protein
MVTTKITTSNSTTLKPAALLGLVFFFGKFIVFLRMLPSTPVLEPNNFPLEFFSPTKKEALTALARPAAEISPSSDSR